MENIYYSIKGLKGIVKGREASKIVLVSSGLLIEKLNWAVKEIQKTVGKETIIIDLPDGEKAKDWVVLERLLKKFLKNGLDRGSIVIAFGGGTVTDVVGFACSVYMRGISCINVPTTLLGMVDASIGGKTTINFSGYKNQIGTFHKPAATIIDARFLKTLNKNQFTDGLAEIIKAGLVKDASILKIIESNSPAKLAKPPLINELIRKSISVKEYYVAKDPKDIGSRQILNFGHTIGHALELRYGLSHGQAVMIGMLKELELAEKLGLTTPDIRKRLNDIFDKLNISFGTKKFKIDYNIILHDKKVSNGFIALPIIKRVGESKLIKVSLTNSIVRHFSAKEGGGIINKN